MKIEVEIMGMKIYTDTDTIFDDLELIGGSIKLDQLDETRKKIKELKKDEARCRLGMIISAIDYLLPFRVIHYTSSSSDIIFNSLEECIDIMSRYNVDYKDGYIHLKLDIFKEAIVDLKDTTTFDCAIDEYKKAKMVADFIEIAEKEWKTKKVI